MEEPLTRDYSAIPVEVTHQAKTWTVAWPVAVAIHATFSAVLPTSLKQGVAIGEYRYLLRLLPAYRLTNEGLVFAASITSAFEVHGNYRNPEVPLTIASTVFLPGLPHGQRTHNHKVAGQQ